jgi:hypothetical protein
MPATTGCHETVIPYVTSLSRSSGFHALHAEDAQRTAWSASKIIGPESTGPDPVRRDGVQIVHRTRPLFP